MHYKNGREAKNGDKVVWLPCDDSTGNNPAFAGILYSATVGGNATCYGRLAPSSKNDHHVDISECLHVDDIAAVDIPDSSRNTG